ncbi:MAG: RNA degradosome polyphosphate kinase, partial [Calditrichae bacterium]|nr:RNA degradosome polyphosphate kinase [Calditrichia bacterium]
MQVNEVQQAIAIDSPQAYINRELSWLSFARRVLGLVEDPEVPLLERVRFAGIIGMLQDEFFMKRMSGLKRMIRQGINKRSIDGLTASEQIDACRKEILQQMHILSKVMARELRPGLKAAGISIVDYQELNKKQKNDLQKYFRSSVQPILTPLAVDA